MGIQHLCVRGELVLVESNAHMMFRGGVPPVIISLSGISVCPSIVVYSVCPRLNSYVGLFSHPSSLHSFCSRCDCLALTFVVMLV